IHRQGARDETSPGSRGRVRRGGGSPYPLRSPAPEAPGGVADDGDIGRLVRRRPGYPHAGWRHAPQGAPMKTWAQRHPLGATSLASALLFVVVAGGLLSPTPPAPEP